VAVLDSSPVYSFANLALIQQSPIERKTAIDHTKKINAPHVPAKVALATAASTAGHVIVEVRGLRTWW